MILKQKVADEATTQKALFRVPPFTAELSWTDLAAELPAWEISACPRGEMANHLDGVDLVCPWGAPVDAVAVHAPAAGRALRVVEALVPQLRRVPPGEVGWVFTLEPDHVGIETFDDLAGQIAWSHHWIEVDGRLVRHCAPYRYVWPSELDLMAKSDHTPDRRISHAVRPWSCHRP